MSSVHRPTNTLHGTCGLFPSCNGHGIWLTNKKYIIHVIQLSSIYYYSMLPNCNSPIFIIIRKDEINGGLKKDLQTTFLSSQKGFLFTLKYKCKAFLKKDDKMRSQFWKIKSHIYSINYLGIRNFHITPASINHMSLSKHPHLNFIAGKSNKSKTFWLASFDVFLDLQC